MCIDVSVLVPEMFPLVYARGAAVPMSLPAVIEVFSFLCHFCWGSLLMQPPWSIGTGMDGVSVLPDAGSELPADSDKAAAERAAPLDEAVENALEVVGLDVGQARFRADSEVRLPMLVNEHSIWGDFVRTDTARVIQVHMSMWDDRCHLK